MVSVRADGKPSLTRFGVIERFEAATLIEARPITGRTHQIRVHAQFAGHALAGDPKYGNDEDNARLRDAGLKRLFLHSASISCFFPHLERQMKFEAPLPFELEGVLDNLRVRK
jgi:23S rRNA pseudouridine955/2504/2580 synthase